MERMDYNMDLLSSMLLGDLELFPECVLADGLEKDESVGTLGGHGQLTKSVDTSSISSLTEDVFPDWLDLKMDMSLLEGLETPDVLDDLLLGEVATGQSLDILPALQVEAKTFPNHLNLDYLPHEQLCLNIESSRVVSSPAPPPPPLDVVQTPQASPPSSPEWQVPDVSLYSPASFLSPISEPASPGYMERSISSSPMSSEDIVDTPMATAVIPNSVIAETSVASPYLSLDGFLSLQILIDSKDTNIHIIHPMVAESEISSPSPTPAPVVVEKPKRNKLKAARKSRNNSANLKASRPPESDSEDTLLPSPISKKERKRKQNKDAAMRYRIKKRIETDVLADEENELLEENQKLKDKAQQLSKELGYLKNLMREMFKVKGLLK